jgi:hypothetical protein
MKTQELIALLKTGKQPMVRLTNELWDESWGQKNMVAKVLSCNEKNDNISVVINFDYRASLEHNLSLQPRNYYLKDGNGTKNYSQLGTAAEAGQKEDEYLNEEVYFEIDGEVPVELVEDNQEWNEYQAFLTANPESKMTYVQWLEKIVRNFKNATNATNATVTGD